MKILEHKDTNEFAYLIGMIATDGCVIWKGKTKSAKDDRCSITQHTKNIQMLNEMKRVFGGNVYSEKTRSSSVWRTKDTEFVTFLRSIGFKENKTFTLNLDSWFDSITDIQKIYFVRGVLDGDGNVFYDKRSNVHHKISIFSASKSFITMLAKYFNNSKIYTQNAKGKFKGYKIVFNSSKCIGPFEDVFSLPSSKMFIQYKEDSYIKIKEHYNGRSKRSV